MIRKKSTSHDGNLNAQRFNFGWMAKAHETIVKGAVKVKDHNTPPAHTPPVSYGYASLFLSDMHLGARACRDESLLEFLQSHHAPRIYLVGDVFDTWHGIAAHWSEAQHDIITLLLARAAEGVQIIYTPGNHDAFFRPYIGASLGNISIQDHVIHTAGDGRRYLVIHGDSIDIFAGRYPVMSRLAARAENALRGLGNSAQHLLRRFDLPISDQVDWLVLKVNDLIRKRDDFQARLAALARRYGADGIICGHYHQPALHDHFGVTYANCGDWVENATALAEDHNGKLVQLEGAMTRRSLLRPAPLQQPLIADI